MRSKIDSVFVIISVILGAVFGMVAEFVCYRHGWIVTGVPAMVICMAVFSVGMSVALIIRGMIKGSYSNPVRAIALGLVALILLMGFTGLFEFIYERDITTTTTRVESSPSVTTTTTTTDNNTGSASQNNQSSSSSGGYTTQTVTKKNVKSQLQYVFLVDDSDSMNHPKLGNDKNDVRYDVVEEVVHGFGNYNQFAVYRFGTGVTRDVEMGSAEARSFEFNRNGAKDGGETYLMTAISSVIGDIDTKNIATNIIVLTDGEPSDGNIYDDVVNKCKQNNVMVSCVGFGDADEEFLEKITKDTNGIYAFSRDVSELLKDVGYVVEYVTQTVDVPQESSNGVADSSQNTNTTTNVTTDGGSTTRTTTKTVIDHHSDLLGRRNVASIPHMFMRIIFLVLMGLIWTLAKQLIFGDKGFDLKLAIITFIVAAAGAVGVEIFIPFVPGILVRLVFYAMWGLTIIPEFEVVSNNFSSNVDFGGYTPLERNNADDLWNKPSSGGGTNSFL